MAELIQASSKAVEEFESLSDEIIQNAVQESMAYQNEIAHHGDDAYRMIKTGFDFTYKMLRAAISTGEPEILDEQAKWAVSRLPHDNISIDNLIRRLRRMKRSVNQTLSKQTAEEITPFIDFLVERIEYHNKLK